MKVDGYVSGLAMGSTRNEPLPTWGRLTGCPCGWYLKYTPPLMGWNRRRVVTTELKVEGMSCGHCKMTVEKALKNVPGVEKVEVFLDQGRAVVQGQAPISQLIEAVEEEGYQASVQG